MEDPQTARAFLLLLSYGVCGQDGNRGIPAMDKDVGAPGVELLQGWLGVNRLSWGRSELQRQHTVRNGLGSSSSGSQLPSLQFLEGILSGVSKKS